MGYGNWYLEFYFPFPAADIIMKSYLYMENLELQQGIFSHKAEGNEVRILILQLPFAAVQVPATSVGAADNTHPSIHP